MRPKDPLHFDPELEECKQKLRLAEAELRAEIDRLRDGRRFGDVATPIAVQIGIIETTLRVFLEAVPRGPFEASLTDGVSRIRCACVCVTRLLADRGAASAYAPGT